MGMQSFTIINASQTSLISHNIFALIIMKKPIVLHALDVSSINPFAELVINSPDTDVLLLLVYYQSKLCNRTLFRTGRKKDVRSIDVKDAYESIGSNRAKALLCYHAFGGSDFTCTFNRKSKLTTWRHHS